MEKSSTKKTTRKSSKFTESDQRDMHLFTLLGFTQDTLSKAREQELKFYNLTLTRAGILHLLRDKKDGCTISDMSSWCSRERVSMVALIGRMEKDGLIEKLRSYEDGRNRIKITPKGKKLYDGVKRESIRIFFSVLTETEKKQLESVLKKLRDKAREILGIGFRSDYIS